ncbi:hypothetical protein RLIN73S_00380 [Rhodanobacter lindaniclasticus]
MGGWRSWRLILKTRRTLRLLQVSAIDSTSIFEPVLGLRPVRNAGREGKNMRVVRQEACLWVAMLFALACAGQAQTAVTPEDEYKKLIGVSEDIQSLWARTRLVSS